jgi:hypothetical protein
MRIAGQFMRCLRGAMLLLLVAPGGMPWGQDRPLPEVAREKTGKTASRVFTNEDLETAHPQESSAPVSKTSQEAVAEKESKARITVPGLLDGETLSQARKILESLRRDEEVLLRRYAQIQEKLIRETDGHLRQLYSDSLARRDETLSRKRRQMAQVEKAIEAAERAPAPRSKDESTTEK